MKKLLCIVSIALWAITAWGIPARPTSFDVVQPNGDTLTIRLVGDERFHYETTEDGYLIRKNDKGYYCYARWERYTDELGRLHKKAVPQKKVAKNADKRSKCEMRWIRRHNIDKR